MRLSRRQLDALIMALVLPAMLMVMFVELFGGAIATGTRYVTYVVPGVLLLCAGYGSGLTAVAVCQDMTGGFVDRLRSLDVRGPAVLAGHVTASVTRTAASIVLVIAVGILLGFRPTADPLRWAGAVGVVLAFIVAISWLSAAVGLIARTAEAANGLSFLLMFLPYASSAFVPVRTMPAWIRGFAGHQPITAVTEAIRGLLLGPHPGSHVLVALAWCGGILAVSVALAGMLFARRS